MNFDELSVLIENSIRGLNVDPVQCRGDKAGKWTLQIKGGTVWIDIINYETQPGVYYLQVMSPLFKVSENHKSGIENDLLEYAYLMYGSSVCKRENWYFVMSLREAADISQNEVDRSIDRVGHYSNDIYGKFKFKYPEAGI